MEIVQHPTQESFTCIAMTSKFWECKKTVQNTSIAWFEITKCLSIKTFRVIACCQHVLPSWNLYLMMCKIHNSNLTSVDDKHESENMICCQWVQHWSERWIVNGTIEIENQYLLKCYPNIPSYLSIWIRNWKWYKYVVGTFKAFRILNNLLSRW
jgi:hypothetical protein